MKSIWCGGDGMARRGGNSGGIGRRRVVGSLNRPPLQLPSPPPTTPPQQYTTHNTSNTTQELVTTTSTTQYFNSTSIIFVIIYQHTTLPFIALTTFPVKW